TTQRLAHCTDIQEVKLTSSVPLNNIYEDVISSTFAGSFSSSSVHEDALSAPNQVFARQPGPGVGHTA
ncbi:hypothetical protein B296_00055389, partial [Ensete ventricosum]